MDSGQAATEPDETSARRLRQHLASGVAVVTTLAPDGYHGATVTAFSVASLRPLLVLVCLERPSQTERFLREAGVFAVSLLSYRQMFLADRFAGRAPLPDPRLAGIRCHLAVTGAPVLEGCVAWMDCRVVERHPVGDHTVVVGRVVAGEVDERQEPLLYFRQRYRRLPPAD